MPSRHGPGCPMPGWGAPQITRRLSWLRSVPLPTFMPRTQRMHGAGTKSMPRRCSSSTTCSSILLLDGFVTINRRIDEHVVEEEHLLGILFVPAPCILCVRGIKVGSGTERSHESRLVIWGAPHPGIGQPGPCLDGIARLGQLLRRVAGGKELVRADPKAVSSQQCLLHSRIVQRVVEPGDGARAVTKSWVRCDIGDAFAIDVDLSTIAQTLQIFRTGQGLNVDFVGHANPPPRSTQQTYSPHPRSPPN